MNLPVYVANDLDFFNCDQSTASGLLEKVVKLWHEGVDLRFFIHYFQDDRQIGRKVQHFGGAYAAGGTEGQHASPNGRPGQARRAGRLHDYLVHGRVVDFVRLAEKYPQQFRRSF